MRRVAVNASQKKRWRSCRAKLGRNRLPTRMALERSLNAGRPHRKGREVKVNVRYNGKCVARPLGIQIGNIRYEHRVVSRSAHGIKMFATHVQQHSSRSERGSPPTHRPPCTQHRCFAPTLRHTTVSARLMITVASNFHTTSGPYRQQYRHEAPPFPSRHGS